MIISKIKYSQNIGAYDEWHLKDVSLGRLNLIVSRNAVGKTRTVNIMNALVNIIVGNSPLLDGNWDVTLENNDNQLRYILRIQGKKVVREQIKDNQRILLNRTGESGHIICFKEKGESRARFSPPANKLTNQVRRDVKQHPFIEDLVKWAENYHSFTFSMIRPTQYGIPASRQSGIVESDGAALFSQDLTLVPYLFKEIENDEIIKRSIIRDLKQVGYDINALEVSEFGAAMRAASLRVFERSISFPIEQQSMSQGMFRVIAIIITIHYLMSKAKEGTIVIDDLCEGLDFSRSTNLASMLFKKVEKENIQLIVTTNDRFLMNSVDLMYWNIFERRGKYVRSFNYANSKEAFDEFILTGISNFDFFARKLYKGLRKYD